MAYSLIKGSSETFQTFQTLSSDALNCLECGHYIFSHEPIGVRRRSLPSRCRCRCGELEPSIATSESRAPKFAEIFHHIGSLPATVLLRWPMQINVCSNVYFGTRLFVLFCLFFCLNKKTCFLEKRLTTLRLTVASTICEIRLRLLRGHREVGGPLILIFISLGRPL